MIIDYRVRNKLEISFPGKYSFFTFVIIYSHLGDKVMCYKKGVKSLGHT